MAGLTLYIHKYQDNLWYKAKVLKYMDGSRKYKVMYDDKTLAREDLTKTEFLSEDVNLREKER